MKIKPLLGEREPLRKRLPSWARFRILKYVVGGLLFGLVSIVLWILTASREGYRQALIEFVAVIPGVLLVVGLVVWYRRSRRRN